jgi:hypothetical protein
VLLCDHLFGSLSAKDFRRLSETLSSLLDDFAYTVRLLKSARAEKSLGLTAGGDLGRWRDTASKAEFEGGVHFIGTEGFGEASGFR